MAEILGPSSRKRKLAAILHADVVGFSRLMGEDEAATHEALGKLRHAVDPLITALMPGGLSALRATACWPIFRVWSTRSAAPSRCSAPDLRSMSPSRRSVVSSCGS